MCQVIPVPFRATLAQSFARNVHHARAWYVRAYMALPPRLMPWCVMPARVGVDTSSHVRFVRL